jgi:hypothetical protein
MTGDQFETRLIQAWSLSETIQVDYDLFSEMVDFFMPKEDKRLLWVDVNWIDDTYVLSITKVNLLLIAYCRKYGRNDQSIIDAIYLKYLRDVLLLKDSNVRFGFAIFIQAPEKIMPTEVSFIEKIIFN